MEVLPFPRVIVTGPSESSNEAVARAVLQAAHVKQVGSSSASATHSEIETAGLRAFNLEFNNAYYTASAHVCLAPGDADLREVLAMDDPEIMTCALVMAFDASKPSSFKQAVKMWEEVVEAHGEELEATLCVAHNATFSTMEEEMLNECLVWCSENCVEFVRANAELPELGMEDGENYARVFGALETVMWPNMELKKKKSNDTPQTNDNNSNAGDVDVTETVLAPLANNANDTSASGMSVDRVEESNARELRNNGGTGNEPEINGKEPKTNGKEQKTNVVSGIGSSPLAESASALSLVDNDTSNDDGREKEMASMFASVLKTEGGGNGENEREENAKEEDGFDLNSWIGKIQGMRQSVGNLSDDERRNRASDLAMQLLSTLDIGEESD